MLGYKCRKLQVAILFFVLLVINGRGSFCPAEERKEANAKWPDIVQGFSQAIELFPKSYFLYWARGLAREKVGDNWNALFDFDEALRLNPRASWVYVDRGNLYKDRCDFSAAINDYDAAIAIDPRQADVFAARAVVWHARFCNDRAIADLDEALRLNPKSDVYLALRAWCFAMRHEPKKAIADANSALSLSRTNIVAIQARAFANMETENFDSAGKDLDELLRIRPDYKLAYLYRSGLNYLRHDYTAAEADLRSSGFARRDGGLDNWLQDAAKRRMGGAVSRPSAETKRRMARGEFTVPSELHAKLQEGFIRAVPDYLDGINKRYGLGVEPSDNAVVALHEVLGPVGLTLLQPDEFYALLGMTRPAAGKRFLTPLSAVDKTIVQSDPMYDLWYVTEPAWKEYPEAVQRPWSEREFPKLARCLAKNRDPLKKLVEASRRSRYYCPALSSLHDWPIVGGALTGLQPYRELEHLLAAQAMLKLGDGDVNGAWEVTIAMFRWSQLLAHGHDVIERLLASMFHERACKLVAAIAHDGGLTSGRIKELQADLKKIPRFPSLAHHLRYKTRYEYLDAMQRTACHGPVGIQLVIHAVTELSNDPNPGKDPRATGPPYLTTWVYNESVDWDEVMRLGGLRIEQAARIFEQPARDKRDAAVRELENHLHSISNNAPFKRSFAYMAMGIIPREVTSADVADVLVCLMMPNLEALCNVEDRNEAALKLANISLALAAYRCDHASYPDRLAALVPGYLPEVPRDLFAAGDLLYSKRGKGYVLYSVGPNRQDDGGRTRDDNPPGDDIAIRVPWTKSP